jgi:DNA-binding MarR family transcriptional regulator
MDPSAETLADRLYAGIQLTRPLLRNITTVVERGLQGTGLTVAQRAILEVLLAQDEATAPEITALLQVTRQFTGRELKEMAALGLVQTRPNPRRKSSHLYSLTPQSRATITAVRKQEMAAVAEFAARFTPQEIDAFHKVQSALNREFSGEDGAG